ncbi:hypothetical protein A8708_13850 [Paenibacillus oryzisoli]|uniref:Uncharacterized protein n=1 Tax=Paenibacillus oryzisoli TaxID=1850517 RepID=A0A198A200_9BACL|nr:hypothetical protein A8708_13850 [Paenibacillus oryzisoli]
MQTYIQPQHYDEAYNRWKLNLIQGSNQLQGAFGLFYGIPLDFSTQKTVKGAISLPFTVYSAV